MQIPLLFTDRGMRQNQPAPKGWVPLLRESLAKSRRRVVRFYICIRSGRCPRKRWNQRTTSNVLQLWHSLSGSGCDVGSGCGKRMSIRPTPVSSSEACPRAWP